MTLRSLRVWLTRTLHRHMEGGKKDQGLNPLVLTAWSNVIAMIQEPHALLGFQSHPSPLAVHPHTARLPTPNTSLPAKYVGRQVIQDERVLSPCRESQWDLWRCPSQSIAAQQCSNSSPLLGMASAVFDHSHTRKLFPSLYLASSSTFPEKG